jgi:hypothetical protein
MKKLICIICIAMAFISTYSILAAERAGVSTSGNINANDVCHCLLASSVFPAIPYATACKQAVAHILANKFILFEALTHLQSAAVCGSGASQTGQIVTAF